jgi:hypothetical protein
MVGGFADDGVGAQEQWLLFSTQIDAEDLQFSS